MRDRHELIVRSALFSTCLFFLFAFYSCFVAEKDKSKLKGVFLFGALVSLSIGFVRSESEKLKAQRQIPVAPRLSR